MIDHVRIVVVGDVGVGKSTIIRSLITETFDPDVPPVVPNVHIPPEVTPEKVHVSIIDTPPPPASSAAATVTLDDTLREEMTRAHVLVLVYDCSRADSLQRVPQFWMPLIKKLNIDVPVVLVGNKMDLRPQDMEDALESQIKPIMEEFKELDVCIECSAKASFNVAEVFFFAQKSVLHPTKPLYDVATHSLKPAAIAALKRVFKLCDHDKDGQLSDKELNNFQYECFNVQLQEEELVGVKKVVKENCVNGLTNEGGVSLDGFIYLHKLFIQRGRLETTWTVLRKFGYDDDLVLRQDYARITITKNDDQCVQFSEKGMTFLDELFIASDKDKDGLLSPQELKDLFVSVPTNPWDTHVRWVVPSAKPNHYSKDAYLARWAMQLMDDPQGTLLILTYLGYSSDATSAINISNRRRKDIKSKEVTRDIFKCIVLGSPGSGKTELLRGLAKQPFGSPVSAAAEKTIAAARNISVGEDYGGGNRMLMMQEIPESRISELMSSRDYLDSCDLVCLTYDTTDSSSFSYALNLLNSLWKQRPQLPCVFVATKIDQPPVVQDIDLTLAIAPKTPTTDSASSLSSSPHSSATKTPDEICEDIYGLPKPVPVSMKTGENSDLYELLVGVCLNPIVACPNYYEEDSRAATANALVYGATAVVVLAALAGTAYGIKKLYDAYKDT